jgi:hypothetical protein
VVSPTKASLTHAIIPPKFCVISCKHEARPHRVTTDVSQILGGMYLMSACSRRDLLEKDELPLEESVDDVKYSEEELVLGLSES